MDWENTPTLEPGTKGISRIVTGIALCGLTLNFLALNHILPAIGVILLLLGFRQLRGENIWFRVAYIAAILRLTVMVPVLSINATVYRGSVQESAGSVITFLICGAQLMMYFAFWRAIVAVREKSGAIEKTSGAGALVIWYSLLFAAETVGSVDGTAAIVIVVAFVLIMISLARISGQLKTSGYQIMPPPVRISDGRLVMAIVGTLGAGIALGYAFGSGYPMEWTPTDTAAGRASAIHQQLLTLGYPEEQLNDLSPQELELLREADLVVVKTEENALNNGVEITEMVGDVEHSYIDHPVKELSVTHVALRLAGDGTQGESWRMIHHFALDDELKVRGTSCLALELLESLEGWEDTEDLSGRLLCSRNGNDVTANYVSMGKKPYLATESFGMLFEESPCLCDFSMPKDATERRGYVAYTSRRVRKEFFFSAWMHYIHQTGYVQYPVKTAGEYVQEGLHLSERPFTGADCALQFEMVDGQPSVNE